MSAPFLLNTDLPDESRGPDILAAVISTTLTALIVVCLRIYARIWMLRRFGADDYVILLAMLLSLAGMGIVIAEVQHGVGRHAIYLNPEITRMGLKLNFISQPIYQWAIPIAKVSIGLSLIRTGPTVILRRIIQGLIIFLLAFTSARFVLLMLQCINMPAIWDPRVQSKCLSPETMRGIKYTNSIVNVITDIFVLSLAAFRLWTIQTNTRARILCVCVLFVGVIACIAGVMKPISLMKIERTNDALWDSADLTVWNPVELNAGIIAASLPFIKPIFQRLQETTARSISFSTADSYSLRPFSSSNSGRRASKYFSPQIQTKISARCRRNPDSWMSNISNVERGAENIPNEITRTTVVTVDSTAQGRSMASSAQQSFFPQAFEDKQ
ncbi:uncharacterized protein GGS22DRAFT_193276 [Annulohypoxylon maeteangense]|uniref:uncharacterized protein n=1 Tax=Annulohypoxylon maeteangense TaxID=1927788 RepID=UPI002008E5E9|nr:uncharacterized protein GGS22DRAFT_193276 [Annulohypoxylon maeteangense]KAI0880506.1 hypothetical protein GGS22DRAFT_193276 [Annulohypoxylon maeteangense]